MENPTNNTTLTPDKLTSIRSVAQRLNLSVRAIYRLIARGELPRPVKVGGAKKFFESDITAYFDALLKQRDRR